MFKIILDGLQKVDVVFITGSGAVLLTNEDKMMYTPLKDKCHAAVIRKAWRDAPAGKAKDAMLAWADRLWSN